MALSPDLGFSFGHFQSLKQVSTSNYLLRAFPDLKLMNFIGKACLLVESQIIIPYKLLG